jgi:SlyX protein
MDEILERLTELEIRYSHQTVQLEELSSEVLAFGQRIERLELENRRLREMLGSLAPELIESPDEWSA